MALCTSRQALALCQTFASLASRTWHDLRDALTLRCALGEESITDYLLLELKRSHPHEVVVTKFTRAREGRVTGADWEWWFRSSGHWFGMLVQAKKLDGVRLKYPEIGYKNTSGRSQIDLLLEHASKQSVYPIYCFYNYWNITSCPATSLRCIPPRVEYLGCTIADAYSVKHLIESSKTDLLSILRISLPWTCLVCFPRVAAARGRLPYRVHRVVRILKRLGAERLNTVAGVPAVTEQPPPYVVRSFEMRNEFNGEVEAERVDAPAGIRGIVILSEPEER